MLRARSLSSCFPLKNEARRFPLLFSRYGDPPFPSHELTTVITTMLYSVNCKKHLVYVSQRTSCDMTGWKGASSLTQSRNRNCYIRRSTSIMHHLFPITRPTLSLQLMRRDRCQTFASSANPALSTLSFSASTTQTSATSAHVNPYR